MSASSDPQPRARSYGRGARILSVGIASTGALTLAYFSTSSHVLGEAAASRIALLWSVMFVLISVIYRPIEQLLSRYGDVVEVRSPLPWTMLLVRL